MNTVKLICVAVVVAAMVGCSSDDTATNKPVTQAPPKPVSASTQKQKMNNLADTETVAAPPGIKTGTK